MPRSRNTSYGDVPLAIPLHRVAGAVVRLAGVEDLERVALGQLHGRQRLVHRQDRVDGALDDAGHRRSRRSPAAGSCGRCCRARPSARRASVRRRPPPRPGGVARTASMFERTSRGRRTDDRHVLARLLVVEEPGRLAGTRPCGRPSHHRGRHAGGRGLLLVHLQYVLGRCAFDVPLGVHDARAVSNIRFTSAASATRRAGSGP